MKIQLICWHFDHSKNRSVKGLNLLNCIYQAGEVSGPVAYELVRKPIPFCDRQTRQVKRKSEGTKNQLLRQMLRTCQQNRLSYRYVLADSWFSAKENLSFIRQDLKVHLSCPQIQPDGLSSQDKAQGRFVRIDTLDWSDPTPVNAWIKGLPFPVLLHRRVFTNKDDSTGILYLACSDLDQHGDAIETIYQKRWKVEVFHHNAQVPCRAGQVADQTGPYPKQPRLYGHLCGLSLEWLRIKHRMNPFALRSKLYLKAIRHAFDELQKLKAA